PAPGDKQARATGPGAECQRPWGIQQVAVPTGIVVAEGKTPAQLAVALQRAADEVAQHKGQEPRHGGFHQLGYCAVDGGGSVEKAEVWMALAMGITVIRNQSDISQKGRSEERRV